MWTSKEEPAFCMGRYVVRRWEGVCGRVGMDLGKTDQIAGQGVWERPEKTKGGARPGLPAPPSCLVIPELEQKEEVCAGEWEAGLCFPS